VTLALIVILAMIALTIVCAVLFARIRKTAALLLLPYLAWLCFAAWLNWQIMVLNPGAEALVPQAGSADIQL
jgi:tryptophan-rich sensory protein